MHTSGYSSVTFHHDSDRDGCMYATDANQRCIVTSRQILEEVLNAFPENASILLVGPDGDKYDRHLVTAPSYTHIGVGEWECLRLEVDREDIEAFLVSYRTKKLIDLVEQLESSVSPAVLSKHLDTVFAQLEPLVKQL